MKTADGKQIMVKYFSEGYYMYKFLREHKEYEMVNYSFTFAYGYRLQYVEN